MEHTTSRASFMAELRAWMAANPGEHRPVDVADAMGVPTHTVAARLILLANRGEMLRRRTSKSKSVYSAPAQ